MSQFEDDHPRGHRSNAGSFSQKAQSPAQISLDPKVDVRAPQPVAATGPIAETYVVSEAKVTGAKSPLSGPEALFVIYGLRLASSSEYRYVGQTTAGLPNRLYQHQRAASRSAVKLPSHLWLQKHLRDVVVADVLLRLPFGEHSELDEAEIAFISHFRKEGHRLLNVTDGGGGSRGYVPSDATRPRCRPSSAVRAIQCMAGIDQVLSARCSAGRVSPHRRTGAWEHFTQCSGRTTPTKRGGRCRRRTPARATRCSVAPDPQPQASGRWER
jgi:hypothetical protein